MSCPLLPHPTRSPSSRIIKPCHLCYHLTITTLRGRRSSITPTAIPSPPSSPSSPHHLYSTSIPSSIPGSHYSSPSTPSFRPPTLCPRCNHDQDSCAACRGRREIQRFLWRCWSCEAENGVDARECVRCGRERDGSCISRWVVVGGLVIEGVGRRRRGKRRRGEVDV